MSLINIIKYYLIHLHSVTQYYSNISVHVLSNIIQVLHKTILLYPLCFYAFWKLIKERSHVFFKNLIYCILSEIRERSACLQIDLLGPRGHSAHSYTLLMEIVTGCLFHFQPTNDLARFYKKRLLFLRRSIPVFCYRLFRIRRALEYLTFD